MESMNIHEAPQNRNKLPLPIGVSDFRETVLKYYYVDKMLLIRDFLDTIPKVSLFTRPGVLGRLSPENPNSASNRVQPPW